MIYQPLSRIARLLGLLILTFVSCVQAQTGGMSAPLVLRSQAASIADESIKKLGPAIDGMDNVAIAVTGGTARALVENAFLDLLGRRGIRVSLPGTSLPARQSLQLTILDQSVRYAGLTNGDYRREIQTAIEARRTSNDTAAAEYLGLFKRQVVDTVAFREDTGMVTDVRDGERTLFDRLLGPILMIGGAFLIVYLFFTVRN
jgi:hypothetical protein